MSLSFRSALIVLFVLGFNLANPSEANAQERFKRLLKRFDKDGDGRLSESEREEMRAVLKRFRGGMRGQDKSEPATPATINRKESKLYKVAPGPNKVTRVMAQLKDEARKKTLSLAIHYPEGKGPFPVIVYSHGAFGSNDGYQVLMKHWASHGYVTIQPTHEDSLKLLGPEALQNKSMAFSKWATRPADIKYILDHLNTITEQVPALSKKLDPKKLGVGGHSFGAHTSQLLGGTRVRTSPGELSDYSDSRPLAFLLISPQGLGDLLVKESWKTFTRPRMIISGDNDTSGRNGKPAIWRTDPFKYSPKQNKYLVWIKDAHHSFGGISGTVRFRNTGPDNPDHVALVQSSSMAFWDAHILKNPTAIKYLSGDKLTAESQGLAKLSRGQDAEQSKKTVERD